jgi:phosphoribosylanthranilate isomerase
MLRIVLNTVIQIYEIQTPDEARAVIGLGVDHIGSVIASCNDRHDPVVRETVSVVRKMGAVSSLIPLYSDPEAVFDTLDYYRPHIVHFCDRLDGGSGRSVDAALALQASVRRRFPDIHIMRSIPIGQTGAADRDAVLALAARLEPLSDYFLTDTMIVGESGATDGDQPVDGFVGITGITCDWSVAAQLVAKAESRSFWPGVCRRKMSPTVFGRFGLLGWTAARAPMPSTETGVRSVSKRTWHGSRPWYLKHAG